MTQIGEFPDLIQARAFIESRLKEGQFKQLIVIDGKIVVVYSDGELQREIIKE